MAKKVAKEENLNLFYLDKNKENKRVTNNRPINQKKKKSNIKKKKENNKKNNNEEIFDFNNEIIIGINKLENKKDEFKKTTNLNKKKKNKKQKKIQKKVKTKEQIFKLKLIKFFIKWILVITLLIGSIILFFMTPVFNITEVNILGNSKISKEQILSISELQVRTKYI